MLPEFNTSEEFNSTMVSIRAHWVKDHRFGLSPISTGFFCNFFNENLQMRFVDSVTRKRQFREILRPHNIH